MQQGVDREWDRAPAVSNDNEVSSEVKSGTPGSRTFALSEELSDIFRGFLKFAQDRIAHVSQMLHLGYFMYGSVRDERTAFVKRTPVQQ